MSRWTLLFSSVILASGTRQIDKTFIKGLLTIQDQEHFKTQDVLLDSTIFLGNTGQKDRVTFMNKIFLYSYLDLISKQARLIAAVSAFLSHIKSWNDVKVPK